METHRYLALGASMAVFLSMWVQSAQAHDVETKITGLLNMPLGDIVGKDANVVPFEVEPSWTIANHHHPGHILFR